MQSLEVRGAREGDRMTKSAGNWAEQRRRVWLVLAVLMAAIGAANLASAVTLDRPWDWVDVGFCGLFVCMCLANRRDAGVWMMQPASPNGEVFGRRVAVFAVPPSRDTAGEFRLGVEVDGVERYSALYEDRSEKVSA